MLGWLGRYFGFLYISLDICVRRCSGIYISMFYYIYIYIGLILMIMVRVAMNALNLLNCIQVQWILPRLAFLLYSHQEI
jgi:hypothetical protein